MEADGANLYGVRGDLAQALRKLGPEGGIEKVVADFEGVTGLQVKKNGIQGVLFNGFQDFRADQAYQEFFVARGHAAKYS